MVPEQEAPSDAIQFPTPGGEEPFIVEIKRYKDNRNILVEERTPLEGVLPDHIARFVIHATVRVNTPMGEQIGPVEIAIKDVDTVQAVYARAQHEITRVVAEISADMREKLRQAQTALLGPDGKPLNQPWSTLHGFNSNGPGANRLPPG